MDLEAIKKTIRSILSSNNYGIRMPADFDSDESLLKKGIIDSFGIYPFVNELQARFNLKIANKEIHPGNLETIEKIALFIYNKKNEEEK
jgi:acyl carrier protein